MQTLKTAVVVILLLVVFFGVYEALNHPPDDLSPDVQAQLDNMQPPDISIGAVEPLVSTPPSEGTPAASPVAQDSQSPFPPAPPLSTDVGSAPPFAAMGTGGVLPPSSADIPLPPTPSGNEAVPAADPQAGQLTVTEPEPSAYVTNPYVGQDPVGQPPVSPPDAPPTTSLGKQVYEQALRSARAAINKHEFYEALTRLSIFYNSQDLTAQEQRELIDLLDPLAAKVVYSREHLMEPPYRVRPNETLLDIAQQADVPWQLLQKINGIEDPRVLLPGAELKIVRGPFRAEVGLQTSELTVFLGELYAGRFPITIGNEFPPQEGEYAVRDKREDRAYFSADGRQIPAESPANPFGGIWLDLGKEVCIHGSPPSGPDGSHGCIGLSPRDAEDVYSILSVGSRVRVLR